jgi:hypothetical protein
MVSHGFSIFPAAHGFVNRSWRLLAGRVGGPMAAQEFRFSEWFSKS